MTIYPLTDYTHVKWPERSRLYHLEPIGIGTPMVESMTSYISRLAEAHGLRTSALIVNEIYPHFSRNTLVPARGSIAEFIGGSLNGVSATAEEFTQIAEALTRQPTLQSLTMQKWSNIFSPMDLVRTDNAWCPICVGDYIAESRPIFTPLAWNIQAVRICPIHRVALQTKCPHCERKHPALSWKPCLGYCPSCGKTLGGTETQNLIGGKEETATEWDLFVAKCVSEILGKAATLSTKPSLKIFSCNISFLINSVAGGSTNRFSKLVFLACRTLTAWRTENVTVRLPRLLLLCRRLTISPWKLLFERLDSKDDIIVAACPETIVRTVVKPFRKHDPLKIREQLEEIIRSNEFPPPSLTNVSRRLSCGITHISRYFSDQAKIIVLRHRIYLKKRKEQRRNKIMTALQAAILELHAAGIFPSKYKIAAKVGLREPWAQMEYRRIMTDLGFRQPSSPSAPATRPQ